MGSLLGRHQRSRSPPQFMLEAHRFDRKGGEVREACRLILPSLTNTVELVAVTPCHTTELTGALLEECGDERRQLWEEERATIMSKIGGRR